MSPNVPRHPAAAHRSGDLLPQPLFNHGFPWHERETHAVIEHRVAPAGQHDTTPIDASHSLPIGYRSMLQAGFGRNVPDGLGQFSISQCCQQVSGENDTGTTPLGQSLVGEEVSTLLHGLLGFTAKADLTQPLAATD